MAPRAWPSSIAFASRSLASFARPVCAAIRFGRPGVGSAAKANSPTPSGNRASLMPSRLPGLESMGTFSKTSAHTTVSPAGVQRKSRTSGVERSSPDAASLTTRNPPAGRSLPAGSLYPPEGWVTLGVDLGKQEDFTVLSACRNKDALPCYFERFNEINWSNQQRIIVNVVRDLERTPGVEGVTIGVDSTGLGDVVLDNLEDLGLDVVPINFGAGHQKEKMVRLLAGDMEHGRAFITEAEKDEFEHYEYSITANGRFKFEAPEGKHDDKVSAKLVQHWCLVHEAPPGVQLYDPGHDHSPDDMYDEIEEDDGVPEVIRRDSPREIGLREEAWNS